MNNCHSYCSHAITVEEIIQPYAAACEIGGDTARGRITVVLLERYNGPWRSIWQNTEVMTPRAVLTNESGCPTQSNHRSSQLIKFIATVAML